MKISGPGSNSPSGLDQSAGVGPAGQGTAAPKQPLAPNAQSDQVQLSSLSAYLASALQGSPAHVAKLNELGAAVSSEQYQVDAYVLSGSIIQHGIEFGGAGYSALTS
jgi:hypothetical protein